ncbi:hypothetical protein B6R96_25685 [Streptomyces sp. Sge12]|nr:hypothetical protein B6R96_25685 [Streptomyces sp. Sge12]
MAARDFPGRPGPSRPPGSKNRRPAPRYDVGRVLAIGECCIRAGKLRMIGGIHRSGIPALTELQVRDGTLHRRVQRGRHLVDRGLQKVIVPAGEQISDPRNLNSVAASDM